MNRRTVVYAQSVAPGSRRGPAQPIPVQDDEAGWDRDRLDGVPAVPSARTGEADGPRVGAGGDGDCPEHVACRWVRRGDHAPAVAIPVKGDRAVVVVDGRS